MTDYEIINIIEEESHSKLPELLHLLEGIWYPQNFNTDPLKFVFNQNESTSYDCAPIENDSNKIVLTNRVYQHIKIEIIFIDNNSISYNVLNENAMGTSPKIIFTK